MQYEEALTIIERAVLSAADFLTTEISSGRTPQVQVKADHTLVMNLDIGAQERIIKALGGCGPVVAEEDIESHNLVDKGDFFLVDPLDGTTSCKRYLHAVGGQVGFGPLAGYASGGVVRAAAFYSVPHRTLYSAVFDQGCTATAVDTFERERLPAWRARTPVKAAPITALTQAGLLFFVGLRGETTIVEYLKRKNAVENFYRFGGFANDCCRLATGLEQVSVQFSVKAWDYAAALFAYEAGLDVVVDPLGARKDFTEWKIALENPCVIVQPSVREELFELIDEAMATKL